MQRGFKGILLMLLVMALSACGSHYSSNAGVSDANPYGVKTKGLGRGSQFDADELEGERYTTRAPSNQVYLFAFDNSTVAKKYLPAIEAQAAYLKNHPSAKVMLAGHTDQVGSREYNVALGERRAYAVYQLLRLSGAKKGQLRVVSYGKERPLVYADTDEAHRKNRRVELIYEAIR
jgi:peptidoglycan-associated lipoprotein